MSSNDYDDNSSDEFEREYEYMQKTFPDASFTISIPIEELDELISKENTIIVKSSYGCYCYKDSPRNSDIYIIQGEKITNRYVIEQLIHQGLNIECNHHFLELIQKVPNTSCEYELWFGS